MFPPFGGNGPYGTYGSLGIYGALVTYGSISLTETSPSQSFNESLTLDEVKDYLKIPVRSPADQAEDDTLTALIIAAREQAEILQNCDLVRKQWDVAYDYWPAYRVELRNPLVSVDLVKYRDSDGNYTTMAQDDDYVVDAAKRPGAILPPYNKSWPTFTAWPSSAILVRFTSGYAPTSAFWSDAGARIKLGMKLLISSWYNNRLPFEKGLDATAEYPFAVSSCLSYGAVPRVR